MGMITITVPCVAAHAVERAADVIRSATWHASGSHVLTVVPLDAAQALADAGLLVTDEMRAVIDAAIVARFEHYDLGALRRLGVAVDTYIAARSNQ